MSNLKIFWYVSMMAYLFVSLSGTIANALFAGFTWQDYLILSNGSSVGIAIIYTIFYLKGEFND